MVFLWRGDVLLQETTQTKNGDKQCLSYYFEPQSFKPVAMSDNGTLYHYHLDHLGTPDTITDENGDIAWGMSYHSYGNVAVKQVNRIEQPLRFQVQYFDEESRLHYNRFRYYDPRVGLFTQQDPIGLLGGINNYQYVPNPVHWVDPLGLKSKKDDCPSIDSSEPDNSPAAKEPIVAGQTININDPSRLAFSNPKPSFTGTSVGWNLYDKQTGAVITEYVKASPSKGPDMYLRPYNAKIEGVGEIKLQAEGFSWTEESIRLNLEAYEQAYGRPAPNLNGELAEANMANFQKEFVRTRKANPDMAAEDIAKESVKNISFGKHRVKAGYGDISVDIEEAADITIDGVTEKNVPTWVYIESKPTTKN